MVCVYVAWGSGWGVVLERIVVEGEGRVKEMPLPGHLWSEVILESVGAPGKPKIAATVV